MQNTQSQTPIWNPSTVTGLSFVFSPAFGSYLLASNWKALGQPEKAASSKVWFWVSLVFLVVLAGLSAVFAGNENSRAIVNGAAIAYFIVWYSLSGRLQVKHVKETFGKKFATRSLVKPVLIGSALLVVYIAVVIGLLIATHAGGDEDQATGKGQATTSSGGPMSNLAGLFGGGPKLDCASDNVKQHIASIYADQLAQTQIPDLIWALTDNRIKITVDTIVEKQRNDQSKAIECSGNLNIAFPKEDLDRATQQTRFFEAQMQDLQPVSDSTFRAQVTYEVATPADEAERKLGPIVEMTTTEDPSVTKLLRTYLTYYQVLAFATPDITATSSNPTPWNSVFKNGAIQACGKKAGVAKCTCKLDALEKVVSEKDMDRIFFAIQVNPMFGANVPNFSKYGDALSQQCPVPLSLASVLGVQEAAAAPVASTAVASDAAVTLQASSPSATQPQAPAQAATPVPAPTPTTVDAPKVPASAIVASFPCDKASSPTEKLICSTPETADADKRLANAYSAARAKASDQTALKQDQRSWLTGERNACADTACLLRVTESRIQKLSAM